MRTNMGDESHIPASARRTGNHNKAKFSFMFTKHRAQHTESLAATDYQLPLALAGNNHPAYPTTCAKYHSQRCQPYNRALVHRSQILFHILAPGKHQRTQTARATTTHEAQEICLCA